MLNLSLKEKMKKILALASAAGITLVTTGCFSDYEKQNDDVAMQPVGYSSDVDSTTPKKEDSTSDFDPNTVTRLVIPEETALRVVITDKKDETTTTASDAIDEVTTTSKDEDYLYTSTTSVTLAKRENRPTATTATKATTKVTLKTTKATKPTTKATTTTTTTTVPVTEPPVVETEPPVVEPELPPVGESLLDKAMYDASSLYSLTRGFRYDLIHEEGATFSSISMPYGNTSGSCECSWIVFAINSDCLNFDSVFPESSGLDESDAQHFETFICNFGDVQKATKKRVKFEEYVKNPEAADLLNQAQEAFFNNTFDSFMANNINSNIIYNPEYCGVNGILCGYDVARRYYNEEDIVNNYLNPLVDRYFNTVYGHSFTR